MKKWIALTKNNNEIHTENRKINNSKTGIQKAKAIRHNSHRNKDMSTQFLSSNKQSSSKESSNNSQKNKLKSTQSQ